MSSLLNQQSGAIAIDFDPFAGGDLLLTAPATESQKEIWASVRMGADANCAYNESQSLRLKGNLDIETLRSALQKLVQRHEALRTTFSPDGTNLCVSYFLELEVSLIDLSALELQEREAQIASLQQQAVRQPFDLEHGPLFRVQIAQVHPQEHYVILTAHHIICDGWSWAVLISDLANLYSAIKQGITPELEEADRFSNYALMLEEESESPDAIATEKYWLDQYADSAPILDFPTDRLRPPFRTFNSAREDWEIDATLVASLKQLGRNLGCSFMTTILAGFEVFLYRLTNQPDIVVGIPAAGQAASGRHNLVGHCVNLLPLLTHIDPAQSFNSYLCGRRSAVLDAYDRQQFTFGSLVKKLALARDPSRIPLVPIIFNIDQGLDGSRLPFDGLEVEFFSNPRSFENFELFINATELSGKVTLECQYNTNLFDADTIRRRLAELETLLRGVVTNPDQSIVNLPLLPESERQLLAQWNQTQVAYPQDQCIHQLVEAQVERSPSAVAVVFEDQQLTYQELDQRANQIAHYLQTLGVGPEVLVGIYVERSLEMVVGVLGILKAGGAYLPLDPAYPQERLSFMLQDASVSILLTQQSLKEKLPEHNATVICLDADWETIVSSDVRSLPTECQLPASNVTPDNLAYIIYTSGSTGKPKGVQVQHRSVVNLLNAVREKPGLTAQDVLLSVTTLSFDIAVSEVFLPLIVGARLVLVSREVATDDIQLLKVLNTSGATFMQPTPATWRLLLASGWQGSPQLKMVSTGEALPRDLANQLLPKGSELWNLYGPTETTIWSTGCKVDEGNQPIYIGYPLANTQTYILDAHLQPVPVGVPGELYIGGAGVTRGYLNRPELTTERFIPDPFSSEPKARLYKTGDLARYLADGQIECLGRIDNQVKLRGFRIELGEVESILGQHPAVRETAAVVREDTPGDKRLVAYVVLHQEQTATASELRSFLKPKLPDYMVPTAFVLLDSLTLTPNGKVDRKALPVPEDAHSGLEEHYQAPRTVIEQQIADIWTQVLNHQRIGIDDNFFELGGHSILAIQVIARLRQTFKVEIPVRTLFEKPTIAYLAQHLETSGSVAVSKLTQNNMMSDYEEGEL